MSIKHGVTYTGSHRFSRAVIDFLLPVGRVITRTKFSIESSTGVILFQNY